MSQQWIAKPTLRNIILAGIIAPVLVGAHGAVTDAASSDDATPASTMTSTTMA